MWPDGRFVVAFEEEETDTFGRLRQSIFAKQYSAAGGLEDTTRVTPVGFDASDGLGVIAWGSDSFVVIWSPSRTVGMMAKRFN